MLETVEKSFDSPLKSTSGFTFPEFDLPPVLPTDVDSLTALLHSLIKSHDDVKLAALNHIALTKVALEEHIALAKVTLGEHIARVKVEAIAEAKAEAKEEYEIRLRELYEQITLMRRRMFGASTESAAQFHLFDEAEVLAATSTEVQDIVPLPAQTPTKTQQPARGKRSPLPVALERLEIIHDVPEAERTCECGTPMVVINRPRAMPAPAYWPCCSPPNMSMACRWPDSRRYWPVTR
jgi:transposase